MYSKLNPDFEKGNGLIPAIIQDANTKNVLMLGYMNAEALEETIKSKKVTFYSRSKNRLWTKGEESGNFLNLVDIKNDCDNDSLLIYVNPVGPVCHNGTDNCWGEENIQEYGFVSNLEKIIKNRFDNPDEESYTSFLFKKGINKIAQKVGEEAVEVIIEAKDNDDNLFKNETADLLYHLLVLLKAKDITFNEVIDVLKERHK